jgi:hypothetical protein
MLWKKFKFYTYAAVIILFCGIYLYNLNPNLRYPNLQYISGTENIQKYLIYF